MGIAVRRGFTMQLVRTDVDNYGRRAGRSKHLSMLCLSWLLLFAVLHGVCGSLPPARDRHQAVVLRFDDERERRTFSDHSIASALGVPVTEVDIWGGTMDSGVVVMLPEHAMDRAIKAGRALPFAVSTTLMPDVDMVVAAQRRTHQQRWNTTSARSPGATVLQRGIESEFFDDYRDMNSVHDYLRELANAHPLIARHIPSIGTSFEGFPLPAIEIGGRPGGPAIYIQATSHSREWISTSTAMALVVELLESEDDELRRIVDELRFFILPIMNPDGYVFSFSEDPEGRMWRKTRKPNDGSPDCPGTDLNRNYDDHWSGVDLPGGPQNCASTDPCSNSYQGDSVWSEPESAAVRDFLAEAGPVRQSNELLGGLDLHSFGQMFNRPYGWIDPAVEVPPNDDATRACGDRMVEAIAAATGAEYVSQYGFDLYRTCGTGMAWLYNITYPLGTSYTVELRDRGAFGFLLPKEEIRPTAVEMLAAMKVYSRHVLEIFRNAKIAE